MEKNFKANGEVSFSGNLGSLFDITEDSELDINGGEWNIRGYSNTINIIKATLNIKDSIFAISKAKTNAVWINGEGISNFNVMNSKLDFSNNGYNAFWLADNNKSANTKIILNFVNCETIMNSNGVDIQGHGIWNQAFRMGEASISVIIDGGTFTSNKNGWAGITLVNRSTKVYDSVTVKNC